MSCSCPVPVVSVDIVYDLLIPEYGKKAYSQGREMFERIQKLVSQHCSALHSLSVYTKPKPKHFSQLSTKSYNKVLASRRLVLDRLLHDCMMTYLNLQYDELKDLCF